MFNFQKNKKDKGSIVLNVFDGLVNQLTSMGTSRSKRSHSVWAYSNLQNWRQFEVAYAENWIARAICDIVAGDMVKQWRTIKGDCSLEVRSEEDRLMLTSKVLEAVTWSRLYGGAAIVMVTNQDLSKPLKVQAIKKGDLKRLIVLDRWNLVGLPTETMDLTSEDFLLPEFYSVFGSKESVIHRSHVVRVCGEMLPLHLRYATFGWGDSSLRKSLSEIEDYVSSTSGVAESLQEFNIDTITKEGLFDELSSDQDEAIKKRFQMWGAMKSLFNVSLLDGNEKYERNGLSYAGVADTIEILMKLVAGSSNIPMSRLFGENPQGLNASSEGDNKNYSEFIANRQAAQLDPAMRKLDEVLVRSALGNFPKEFNYSWNPIETPDEMKKANVAHVWQQTNLGYLEANIIKPSQIMRKLQSEEVYVFDEKEIDELEEAEKNIEPTDEDFNNLEMDANNERNGSKEMGEKATETNQAESKTKDDRGHVPDESKKATKQDQK